MTGEHNGACTRCGRSFKIRDGVVVFHRQRDVGTLTVQYQWPQPPCPGWGTAPQEVSP